MRVWREMKHNLYLHELLDRQASIWVYSICNKEVNWWCLNCFAGLAYCTECCQTSHCWDPFHRIEQWTGTFYKPSWLWKVGLVICLSHKGDWGPNAANHSDAKLETDKEGWLDLEDIPSTLANPKPPDRVHNGGRLMTAIHTSGVHHLPIVFCGCSRAAVEDIQLLWVGLYPSTYKSCQTVFTFQLLDDYLLENLECKTSATHYYSKLRKNHQLCISQFHPGMLFSQGG